MTNIVRFPHNGPTVYDMMPEERIRHLEIERQQLIQTIALIRSEMHSVVSRGEFLAANERRALVALDRVCDDLSMLRRHVSYGGAA